MRQFGYMNAHDRQRRFSANHGPLRPRHSSTKPPRVFAIATVVAVVAAVILVANPVRAAPLSAGASPTAGQTLSVLSGNQITPFTFSYTGDNSCEGDSATDGFRVNSFMVPGSVDVSQLIYTAGGPIAPDGVTFARPLFSDASNAPQFGRNTAPTTGVITGGNLLQPLSFAALAAGGIAVPDGAYKIGLACTLFGATEQYWQSLITVSGSTSDPMAFEWAFGTVPPAPVLGALTVGVGTVTGTFTAAAATPAATYTVTTVPPRRTPSSRPAPRSP